LLIGHSVASRSECSKATGRDTALEAGGALCCFVSKRGGGGVQQRLCLCGVSGALGGIVGSAAASVGDQGRPGCFGGRKATCSWLCACALGPVNQQQQQHQE
jgi:hypothetical protein